MALVRALTDRGERRSIRCGVGRLPVLLLSTVALMAGCGASSKDAPVTSAVSTAPGGASTQTTSSSTPTVAHGASASHMIAAADAICSRLNTALAGDKRTVSVAALAGALAQLARVEQAAVGELAKLHAPAALADDWRRIMADRRKLASNLSDLSRDAERQESTGFPVVYASNKAVEQELLATGRRAGFKSCSWVE